ncbi:unnamed protein product [Dibothriocephalus latus]|uniref:Uncharacterized protein n=1 Tax=Dibothriocephalus latus TaxID=60516 RepID=A0A3P7P7N6_DIBLA|nr:unnamed protein product [Dibothriocephalus latus]
MRGAETGNVHESDHALVRLRLNVHLPSASKMLRAKLVANLRQINTIEALSTGIQSQADSEDSSRWPSLKTSIYGAAEKIIGFTQRRCSDWISGRTLKP